MKHPRADTAACCKTCPFLTKNFGKPNPKGWTPDKSNGEYNWYAPANLRRLWSQGLRKGEPMQCHATDSTASDYGGNDSEPGSERLCIGSLVLVAIHMRYYESILLEDPDVSVIEAGKRYRAAVGTLPMTRNGLTAWAWRFAIGRTNLLGGLPLPRHIDGRTFKACSVPWNDKLVNNIPS